MIAPTTYSERLGDIAILQLSTEGFEALTENQKKLTYHLAQAGLWGRAISMDQGSVYNLPLIDALMDLLDHKEASAALQRATRDSLFILFAHNGIYHSMSGERLVLPLTKELLYEAHQWDPSAAHFAWAILFDLPIAEHRTIQTEGVDGVAQSGGNFYSGLTTQEVVDFRASAYPAPENPPQLPPYGFNERLVKGVDGIEREVVCSTGLYGGYVRKMMEQLQLALPWSENAIQRESIETLIAFYASGDARDFDKHCVAWTQDRDSDIYFINGLIESYEDSLGVACTFESVVAFKNPLQTAKVNKIIESIQWFEDHLPFEPQFKKEKAVGLSASSITVISMAGETAPSLPLGINLPKQPPILIDDSGMKPKQPPILIDDSGMKPKQPPILIDDSGMKPKEQSPTFSEDHRYRGEMNNSPVSGDHRYRGEMNNSPVSGDHRYRGEMNNPTVSEDHRYRGEMNNSPVSGDHRYRGEMNNTTVSEDHRYRGEMNNSPVSGDHRYRGEMNNPTVSEDHRYRGEMGTPKPAINVFPSGK